MLERFIRNNPLNDLESVTNQSVILEIMEEIKKIYHKILSSFINCNGCEHGRQDRIRKRTIKKKT